MMREILFRGKAGAKWVYGDLWHLNDGRVTVRKDGELFPYEVIPETVGQYTGLTDKNGKKIFEGDIVKYYNHKPIKEYSEDIGRVFYYSETCRVLRTSKLFPDDCPEIVGCCEYEVIGNAYDNPEMLKQEGK